MFILQTDPSPMTVMACISLAIAVIALYVLILCEVNLTTINRKLGEVLDIARSQAESGPPGKTPSPPRRG